MFNGTLHEIDKLLTTTKADVSHVNALLFNIQSCLDEPTFENIAAASKLVAEAKNRLGKVLA